MLITVINDYSGSIESRECIGYLIENPLSKDVRGIPQVKTLPNEVAVYDVKSDTIHIQRKG